MSTIHPKSLRVAVALAEVGSATEAARLLHISQPGVSYHLRKLESSLETTLFERGAAGLVPTAEGEVLVAGARAVLSELERLADDVRGAASGRGQTVRLSSSCFTNYHWLPDVLKAFREDWGEVRVELDVDPSRRPFEALDRGALDIALTTVPPGGPSFSVKALFDDEIVAVVHPDHAFASRSHLEPEDFSDQSVVVFDRKRSDLFNLALAPAGVRPREVTDMPVTDALLELVRAGVSISAMASWVARPDLERGTLSAVSIGREGIHRTWWAVTSAKCPTSSTVTRFLEILQERCRAQMADLGELAS
ncbi:MAG: LysR family transcriptional regulator [Gemmatimonadota bacterium]